MKIFEYFLSQKKSSSSFGGKFSLGSFKLTSSESFFKCLSSKSSLRVYSTDRLLYITQYLTITRQINTTKKEQALFSNSNNNTKDKKEQMRREQKKTEEKRILQNILRRNEKMIEENRRNRLKMKGNENPRDRQCVNLKFIFLVFFCFQFR